MGLLDSIGDFVSGAVHTVEDVASSAVDKVENAVQGVPLLGDVFEVTKWAGQSLLDLGGDLIAH